MLEFKKNDTAVNVVLTLNELITISNPYFLFVFKHVGTKDIVTLLLSPADDLSLWPERYNKFLINPSIVFAGKHPGEWHYTVYEQASSSNVDPSTSGEIIENGKLMLGREVEFEFKKYESGTSFKTYNG